MAVLERHDRITCDCLLGQGRQNARCGRASQLCIQEAVLSVARLLHTTRRRTGHATERPRSLIPVAMSDPRPPRSELPWMANLDDLSQVRAKSDIIKVSRTLIKRKGHDSHFMRARGGLQAPQASPSLPRFPLTCLLPLSGDGPLPPPTGSLQRDRGPPLSPSMLSVQRTSLCWQPSTQIPSPIIIAPQTAIRRRILLIGWDGSLGILDGLLLEESRPGHEDAT